MQKIEQETSLIPNLSNQFVKSQTLAAKFAILISSHPTAGMYSITNSLRSSHEDICQYLTRPIYGIHCL